MEAQRRRWVSAGLVAVVGVGFWWGCSPRRSVTHVKMDAEGGFAYVYSASQPKLEIGFLASTDTADCKVMQMGVRLKVPTAQLVEPTTQPPMGFDLGGATITIADYVPSQPLTFVRGNRPGAVTQPADPSKDGDWKDLQWVASTRDGHPTSTLRSDWHTLLDGRLELTSGTLVGGHPGDVVSTTGVWEFKSASGSGTPYTQAITDTTRYSVDVQGDQVVINLTGARSGVPRIVVKGDASHSVQLQLTGIHDDAPTSIPVGFPIAHFCAFYELLTPKPAARDQLIPHFAGNPRLTSGAGQPSPGGLCPGDVP